LWTKFATYGSSQQPTLAQRKHSHAVDEIRSSIENMIKTKIVEQHGAMLLPIAFAILAGSTVDALELIRNYVNLLNQQSTTGNDSAQNLFENRLLLIEALPFAEMRSDERWLLAYAKLLRCVFDKLTIAIPYNANEREIYREICHLIRNIYRKIFYDGAYSIVDNMICLEIIGIFVALFKHYRIELVGSELAFTKTLFETTERNYSIALTDGMMRQKNSAIKAEVHKFFANDQTANK
jgi:hypothetical protein